MGLSRNRRENGEKPRENRARSQITTLRRSLRSTLSILKPCFRCAQPDRAAVPGDRFDRLAASGSRPGGSPQAAGASPWSKICRNGPPSFSKASR